MKKRIELSHDLKKLHHTLIQTTKEEKETNNPIIDDAFQQHQPPEWEDIIATSKPGTKQDSSYKIKKDNPDDHNPDFHTAND